MIPRGARSGSGTRAGVLGCNAVEVGVELGQVDAWRTTEQSDGAVGAHEPVPPEWSQLTDGYAVSGDDEALALVQSPHDLAAVVAKLPLGDVFGHHGIVAQSATMPTSENPGRPCRGERHTGLEGRG